MKLSVFSERLVGIIRFLIVFPVNCSLLLFANLNSDIAKLEFEKKNFFVFSFR